jgi:sulfatase modifying factor 1
MQDEAAFLQAMQKHPKDTALRLVFADWLEERGDKRGELIRLLHTLTQSVKVRGRKKLEDRLRSLLASGVQPVGPFWTNSIGMKFAWVPAGTFIMGTPEREISIAKRRKGEGLDEFQHPVTLTKGFYLAVYPVTQASWRRIMGKIPGYQAHGNDLPVVDVTWRDCQRFLRTLGERDGQMYRLPTEAEWEYACRAGTMTPFSFGNTISTDQANFDGNYPYRKGKKGINRKKPTPVGSFPSNGWGLYDMHGNVSEWCADRWDIFILNEAVVDPKGPKHGQYRVLRGGWYGLSADDLRSGARGWYRPAVSFGSSGFRPVAVPRGTRKSKTTS